ncbi:MAG: hypothetical protein RLZ81_3189 [Pseudomonadota bacterium]
MSHQNSKQASASAAQEPDHGGAVTIARNAMGAVSVCRCGVVTLSLQYISLRLEPGAFSDLQALLNHARHRLDGVAAHAARNADAASLH